ncbi:hypothetical protein EVAR_89310_1 [Eumeta japonica]|uniref:Uncharacterized protein n=1 Tax=Eumeta variegata TaxID=151549 RepID=A0A4C2A555_EUMVA|nr:hypothetical protein EVAR_89310_1 [Eumeta japonica]
MLHDCYALKGVRGTDPPQRPRSVCAVSIMKRILARLGLFAIQRHGNGGLGSELRARLESETTEGRQRHLRWKTGTGIRTDNSNRIGVMVDRELKKNSSYLPSRLLYKTEHFGIKLRLNDDIKLDCAQL